MDQSSVKSDFTSDEDFTVSFNKETTKERKSVEDTVTSLRQELSGLYDSLKDKNEELLCLEKDVRDRDMSIKYLKNEFKKLKNSLAPNCPTCNKKILRPSDQNGNSSEHKTSSEAQPDEILTKFQKDLKDRECLIKELNKKIIRLSDNLIFVQKESLAKDDRLDEMQREVDKFRQVVNSHYTFVPWFSIPKMKTNLKVRPFTKAMVEQRNNQDNLFHMHNPGVENTRVTLATEPSRLKRTAISAEPLSQMQGAENDLVKIPKTSM